MLWILIPFVIIAIPIALVKVIMEKVKDSRIKFIRVDNRVSKGNKLVLIKYYKDGKIETETVKTGNTRFNTLYPYIRQ